MARRLLAVTLLCFSEAASALLLSRPTLRHAARCSRALDVRCGFEVETLKGKDVEDMNILNWPTLEKRLEDFEKSAELDEMMYVYCREGSASLSAEGEEDTTISAGQLVIVNDGAVRWTDISEGGVTLLSTVTPILDADKAAEVAAKGEESPPEDLSLKEAAILLGVGLLFGGLLSVGTKLIQS